MAVQADAPNRRLVVVLAPRVEDSDVEIVQIAPFHIDWDMYYPVPPSREAVEHTYVGPLQ